MVDRLPMGYDLDMIPVPKKDDSTWLERLGSFLKGGGPWGTAQPGQRGTFVPSRINEQGRPELAFPGLVAQPAESLHSLMTAHLSDIVRSGDRDAIRAASEASFDVASMLPAAGVAAGRTMPTNAAGMGGGKLDPPQRRSAFPPSDPDWRSKITDDALSSKPLTAAEQEALEKSKMQFISDIENSSKQVSSEFDAKRAAMTQEQRDAEMAAWNQSEQSRKDREIIDLILNNPKDGKISDDLNTSAILAAMSGLDQPGRKPQVFDGYHGSRDGIQPTRDDGTPRGIMYGTANRSADAEKVASMYAGEDGSVVPVQARFQDPMVVDAQGASFDRIPIGQRQMSLDRIIDQADTAGKDGVVVRNLVDPPIASQSAPPTDIFAALKRGTVYDANGKLIFSNPDDITTAAILAAINSGNVDQLLQAASARPSATTPPPLPRTYHGLHGTGDAQRFFSRLGSPGEDEMWMWGHDKTPESKAASGGNASDYSLAEDSGGYAGSPASVPTVTRFANPLIIDVPYGTSGMEIPSPWGGITSTDGLAHMARQRGHDGLVINGVMDGMDGEGAIGQAIAALKKGTVYSPVTGETIFVNTPDPTTAAILALLTQQSQGAQPQQ